MRDPHVVSLKYKLIHNDETIYSKNAEIKFENDIFKFELREGELVCHFKKHFSDVSFARIELEKLLFSWEIDAALYYGIGSLKLTFIDAEIIDRNPTIEANIEILAPTSLAVVAAIDCKLTVERTKYPRVPDDFITNPDVETVWHRYNMYLEGKEQVLSMAYFVLSFLEGLSGSRRNAAHEYKIDIEVLDKLGNLTSARGDYNTARKGKGHNFIPIEDQEKLWIEQCIKRIIRRLGETHLNYDNNEIITLNNLMNFQV